MRCASCEYRLEQGKMQSKTRKEMQNMREVIQKDLKHYFANIMKQTRKSKKLSQEKMAEILVMDVRSYADLEKEKYLCGTITFIHFMLYAAEDVNEIFEGIAMVVANAKENVA